MKKRIFWLLALAVLIFCPVTSYAAETEEITYVFNAKEISNPIQMKEKNRSSVSGSTAQATVSGSHAMASKKQVDKLYSTLKNYRTSVNLSGYKYTKKSLLSAFNEAMNKNYCLFDSIYRVSLKAYTRNGYITTAYFDYYYSKSTMKKRYSSLVSAVKSAKKSIGTGLSKEQTALAVHDYLIKHAAYDMNYYNYSKSHPGYVDYYKHTAHSLLVKKSGVCSGYAYAYRILMKEYGIPCILIESYSMNHAWNMIKLGSQWYHVDCTWDDPDGNSGWKGGSSGNLVYYNNFLLNNYEIKQTGHYGWSPYRTANSTLYSNMPRYNSNQQIAYKGNWYILYGNDPNYTYTRINFKGTSLYPVVYSTCPVVLYKNRIFYVENETAIRSMNIDGLANRELSFQNYFPSGTKYKLAGTNGNKLIFLCTFPSGESNYYSYALSAYDIRTTDKATSLKLSASSKTIKKKKSFQLRASVGPSWAIDKRVYYKSSNSKVASVGKTNGKVTGRKKGNATITAYVPGTNLRATCKVTVK